MKPEQINNSNDKIGEYAKRLEQGETIESFGDLTDGWKQAIYERMHQNIKGEEKKVVIMAPGGVLFPEEISGYVEQIMQGDEQVLEGLEGDSKMAVLEALHKKVSQEIFTTAKDVKDFDTNVDTVTVGVNLKNPEVVDRVKQELDITNSLNTLNLQTESAVGEATKKIDQSMGGKITAMFEGLAASFDKGARGKAKKYADEIKSGKSKEYVLDGIGPEMRKLVEELL
jgi:hypothetical protein